MSIFTPILLVVLILGALLMYIQSTVANFIFCISVLGFIALVGLRLSFGGYTINIVKITALSDDTTHGQKLTGADVLLCFAIVLIANALLAVTKISLY
jgi:hypothetical protein